MLRRPRLPAGTLGAGRRARAKLGKYADFTFAGFQGI
jgi:hypothetical protein